MVDEWEDEIDNDGGEIEDYTRIPYPDAWNEDPEDSADARSAAGSADDAGDDGFGRELLDAATPGTGRLSCWSIRVSPRRTARRKSCGAAPRNRVVTAR
ncbi:MAG: hypothetical protein ACRDQ4_08695 [Pseudonocardiaceae bacterium]